MTITPGLKLIEDSQITVFTATIGRLWWNPIRNILESEKFAGRKIEWREGRGWLDREFMVRGSSSDVIAVIDRIREFHRRVRRG